MNLFFNTAGSAFYQATNLVALNLVPIEPSYTSDFETNFRSNKVQFGNGYKQEEPDGINTLPFTANLVFLNRRAAVIIELVNFFSGIGYNRMPNEYFFWQPPAPFTGGVIKVKAANWKTKVVSTDIMTLTVTFEQTYEV